MKANEFKQLFGLVGELAVETAIMRVEQRAYFSKRTHERLKYAKAAEQRVDALLDRMRQLTGGQEKNPQKPTGPPSGPS